VATAVAKAETTVGAVFSFFLLLGASVAFGSAVWLAIHDQVQAATLLAGLFAVAVLFYYFPQLESFKAFTIEGKLRERLSQAEDLLAKIQRSALASSEFMFFFLAWGNRMGSPTWETKRQLIHDLNLLLTDLKTDELSVRRLRKPLFGMIAYDLYLLLRNLISTRNLKYEREGYAALNAEQDDGKRARLTSEIEERKEYFTKLMKMDADTYRDPDLATRFRALCLAHFPVRHFSAEDNRLVSEYINKLDALLVRGVEAGNVDGELKRILEDSSRDPNAPYSEVFREEPLK